MSIFNRVARSAMPSNVFKDLTYSTKFDAQVGILYPVHVEEIVPGDIFFSGHGAMVRTQPMVTPVFHNFNYEIRWFFVPNRLVWQNFESFITDQEKGKKDLGSDHIHPYLVDAGGNNLGYLHDLMGVPPLDGDFDIHNWSPSDYNDAGVPINALPFRAYYLIWNEFFKDENTMDDLEYLLTDGADKTPYELQRVSWRKDYFTSALPFAQRGDPVQFIGQVFYDPISGSQQIFTGPGESDPSSAVNTNLLRPRMNQAGDPVPGALSLHNTSTISGGSGTDYGYMDIDPNGTLKTAIPFASIRRANALQKFLERSALGGNRYAELLLAHFGVRSSDKSLQRPQYLGGGRVAINVSPVEQNSGTVSGSTPQGTLAGKGVGVGSMYFNKSVLFKEHGWLLGLAFIRPDADYCNGIRRQLVKNDRFDYYWPDFQNIGEQEIHNYELFVDASNTDGINSKPFGYQSRYAEYKWHGNEIHGQFRYSLRPWVAPREFSETPSLDEKFISCDLDISNNMAVSPVVYPPFMIEAINVVNARRPMYYFNRGVL